MQPKAFECQMCGRCCQGEGGIVVDHQDQGRLASYLKITHSEFVRHYTLSRGQKLVLKSKTDGSCIFFRPSSGCTVHSVKPHICQAWPFFRGNILDPLSWELAQDYCPGINPDIEHREFARQALSQLQSQGLLMPRRSDVANALVIDPQEVTET
jgi:hypothetical protein